MLGQCTLEADINKCPHYLIEKEHCSVNNEVCCFFRKPGYEKDSGYKREPRWYEKYYKNW